MNLRPYAPADEAEIIDLSLRAWAPVFASIERVMSPELYREFHQPDWHTTQRESVQATLRDEAVQTWVCLRDGHVVGFVSIRRASEQIGEIYMVAVDPNHQRQGLGDALVSKALELIRAHGATVAMVDTGGDPGHAPARRTYEKTGFELWPAAKYFKLLK